MRSISAFCLLLSLIAAPLGAAQPKWKLIWSDEFNGKKGSLPDPESWVYDTGGHGWGNNELQFYTKKNAMMDGQGHLVMEARKEKHKDREYTSARLKTQGKRNWTYGAFEARIQVATGRGLWPAFWMLGENITEVSWPTCGEIDIMEYLGHSPHHALGTLHGPGYEGGRSIGSGFHLEGEKGFPDDFHVFRVEWEPYEIRWYIDGKQYHSVTPKKLRGRAWVFDTPFFIIMNIAVGGNLPGDPAPETVFPTRMLVDWVRVYEDENLVIPKDYKRPGSLEVRDPITRKYKGTKTVKLPGLIQVEDYAEGGEGKGYHDADAHNAGGSYRKDEGVDVQLCEDGEDELNVGWTRAGEWLEYPVKISKAGKYTVSARVACAGEGGIIGLVLDDEVLDLELKVPDTGGWQNYQTVTAPVKLPKGKYRLRVVMLEENPDSKTVGNLNWIRFEAE